MDFVKCDDICNTNNQNRYGEGSYAACYEIEMLAKAIQKCGRPIVLSLSPGPALIDKAWHYEKYANMWRITDDFWDNWTLLKNMFRRCELWQNHVSAGCYPDCDMLPLSKVGKGFGEERTTNFTHEEQRTMMTLWCIFGSPLMLGAEMTKLDDWTLSLLTNEEVLSLCTPERQRRQVLRSDEEAVWVSRDPADGKTCAALFNLSDDTKTISVPLTELELSQDACRLRDLWDGKISRCTNDCIQAELPPHGCALYAIEA